MDPDFDLETSVKSDSDYLAETFCEEWLAKLLWEDRTALGLFLVFWIQSILKKKRTEAAELAGKMIGKSMNTMLCWIQGFLKMMVKLVITGKDITSDLTFCGTAKA